VDPTIVAVPFYFASMGAEAWYLRRRAADRGPTPADYTKADTIASLTMGVGSLLAPLAVPKLFGPVTPGKGRYGKALVLTALGATAATTIADVIARIDPGHADPDLGPPEGVRAPEGIRGPDASPNVAPRTPPAEPRHGDPIERRRARRRRIARGARQLAGVGAVAAIVAGGVAVTTTWASRTTVDRLWARRLLPDLGTGPLAWLVAIFGWDFIYYWNHRFMHESRYMWAIHVVHHSSEHYNLSTALRQPVADALGTFAPYSALALAGIRPELILQARGLNLLYQYWIHTDTIRRLGPLEEVFNTPSHHRVHHGSNRQYLDRNHGSILIVWDRLFATFERENEPVVYGLTKNIETYHPLRIATHEHADMLHDVRQARTWRDRLSFVLRSPGWAYQRHAEQAAAVAA
jgi:sterol desaturase/sphingolipid hydroxylase (fatty acid hydroxylase superfamily)